MVTIGGLVVFFCSIGLWANEAAEPAKEQTKIEEKQKEEAANAGDEQQLRERERLRQHLEVGSGKPIDAERAAKEEKKREKKEAKEEQKEQKKEMRQEHKEAKKEMKEEMKEQKKEMKKEQKKEREEMKKQHREKHKKGADDGEPRPSGQ